MANDRDPLLDPNFETYEAAVDHAKRLAEIARVAYTICLEVGRHEFDFYVLTSERYAQLRERGLTHSMAPVASILSNGALNQYNPKSFDYYKRRQHV